MSSKQSPRRRRLGRLWRERSQTSVRRVSVLLGLTENDPEANARIKAFRLGMRDLEWVEGRNIQIDYRFAGSDLDLISRHVMELVKSPPE
jgi:putative ABC transport system substrate-binding protein